MDYDMKPYHQLIEENEKLESMIHIYEKEIDDQQDEITRLKKEVDFLIQQLEYKTLGKPTED
jgi:cell division septum initiation protein DivIVA|tara:strand:+ start:250 stop:435 length:186 start_codon:yes stop_codon:yes gene_type:complete